MIAKTKLSLFAQRGFLQGFRFSCKNIQIIIYNLLVVSFFVDLCFGTVSYDMICVFAPATTKILVMSANYCIKIHLVLCAI